jgi:hypothetical protein
MQGTPPICVEQTSEVLPGKMTAVDGIACHICLYLSILEGTVCILRVWIVSSLYGCQQSAT